MRLAVLTRQHDHISLAIYRDNVIKELKSIGVDIVPFQETGPIPSRCSLVWDPGLGMRGVPRILKHSNAPVVVTNHGLRSFSLPIQEMKDGWKGFIHEYILKLRVIYGWHWLRKKCSVAIAASVFGADDICRALRLPRSIMRTIYHGLDHDTFRIGGDIQKLEQPYFFHVSSGYDPRKNLNRILSAYSQISGLRPFLVLKLTGYRGKDVNVKGVKIICEKLSSYELASWYRGSLGFIFPSLYETFGMPILEAMACGSPVITSNVTSCPEVAGESAAIVDPRSVQDIASAMQQLVTNSSLRNALREKGLKRAREFTWRRSAEEHIKVFEKALTKSAS